MTTVDPERVLRDLRELWTNLAQDQSEGGGVLRACAMTLVATAGNAEDADDVRRTVGVLMHSHPCRAIIVREADGEAEMNAHIFSECWKPFGSTHQICSEGIEITPAPEGAPGAEARMEEVARFLVPLRAPDLPLVLWRRAGFGRNFKRYDALLPLADKVVFDTMDAPDAGGALTQLRSLQAQGRRIGDLNWTRLTGWREVVAHLFDDRALDQDSITSVTVAHGGGRLPTSALYMAAWIRNAMPGLPVAVEAVAAQTTLPGGLASVEFTTAMDHLSVALTKEGCLEVSGAGRYYRSPLPAARVEDLMREELNILGRDPVFERVLAA